MLFRSLIAAGLAASLGTVAFAQTPMTLQNANQMKWAPAPSFLPKGAKMVVLSGNPMGSSGQFVLRLKMPAGYVVPAHWHSTDELLTIISGDFYGGMGDKVDKKKSMVVHSGGFIAMPAKMHHFAWTKKGAVVQINAMAPFDIHYIDPKTDPTKGH